MRKVKKVDSVIGAIFAGNLAGEEKIIFLPRESHSTPQVFTEVSELRRWVCAEASKGEGRKMFQYNHLPEEGTCIGDIGEVAHPRSLKYEEILEFLTTAP
jgi:hypothetical protein